MKRLLTLLAGSLAAALAADNQITITSSSAVAGQPFTISRVFASGDIPAYARPAIGGAAPSVWQCDVMTRWRDGKASRSISGATNAAPIVVTSPAHGFEEGEKVTIEDVQGNTAANGTWVISAVRTDSFSLVNSKGSGAYSSGGSAAGPAAGSVQHALISFVADAPPKKTAVEFVNHAEPCSAGNRQACDAAALTPQQILDFAPRREWGATIETTVAGRKHAVSAREMIEAGAWRYWLRGPAATQVIVEDRTPKAAFDWGYKDRRILVLAAPVNQAATAFDVVDASGLAALKLPQAVRLDGEEVTVCEVRGNRLTVGTSACPHADGRAVNGTTAATHLFGAVAQILSIERPEGWRERVLGSFWRFDAVSTKGGLSTPEFIGNLPRPVRVQAGPELLQVCKVNQGLDGSLLFGADGPCPDKRGRGAEGTTAAAHAEGEPISSPGWSSDWVDAPSPEYKSLHPIFVLTFYRNWKGVKEEFIVENTWATKLQDQFYRLSLRSGRGGEQERFQSAFNHGAMTRWRKTFWDGAATPDAAIDYNLAYMTRSRAIPNYDLTRRPTKIAIDREIAQFNSGDKGELNGHGEWFQAFPTAGGRPDIGLFARWYVRYLYTFDPGLYNVMLGNGAVSAYVPVHFRESIAGKPYRQGAADDAYGHPISLDVRPTVVTRGLDFGGADRIVPVGMTLSLPRGGSARRADGWNVDQAHQPSMPYIPYLITGDWYFLEELYFWGAYDVAYATPGECLWCRHDGWGFLSESASEVRGLGWALRNLAHAAWFAPDGSEEKAHFREKLHHNFALREGVAGLTEGSYYDPAPGSMWSWARGVVASGAKDPLRWGVRDLGGISDPKRDGGCYTIAPWMENYRHVVFGHLAELGFTAVEPLRRWFAVNLLHQIADPAYTPKSLIAGYYIPTRGEAAPCTASQPLATWAEVAQRMPPAELAAAQKRWDAGASDAEHGYGAIALAAASYLPGISDGELTGQAAWDWLKANLPRQEAFHDNPKWAIVPRR